MSQKNEKIRTVQYARHIRSSHYGILLNKNNLLRGYPIHQHDFYEFEVVVSGKVRHLINGESEILVPGDFYCLSPDMVHKAESLSEDSMIYNISVFLPDASEALQTAVSTFSFPSRGRLKPERARRFSLLYDMLFEDAKSNIAMEKEKVGALATYMLLFLSDDVVDSREAPISRRSNAYIQAAMAVVRAEYSRDLRLGEVAEAVGVSPGYLSGVFSAMLGSGFKDYLSAVRISHAMNLLATTDQSVTEIAFLCGFGSFSNFERSFSRFAGMTPTAYRKRIEK